MLWVILIVVGIAALAFAFGYNQLVRRRNRVDNAWGQVDVQLRRRYDLVPNLVETVRAYATHERDTFDQVVAARAAAEAAQDVAEQGAAENALGATLRHLFALAEDYPELRSSENFGSLQAELAETENKIAVARQIYNDTVLTYNNSVETIPTMVVAAVARFATRPFFQVAEEARSTPGVAF